MMLNNIISLLNSNKLNSNDTFNLKIGNIIRVEIIDIIDDTLILKLGNGEILKGKNESNIAYNKGDIENFIITDIDDNKASIKLAIDETFFSVQKEIQANGKNEMIINSNDLKENLIELMAKSEVPITEKNIKAIEDTKKHYGKLADLIHNNNIKDIEKISRIEITELIKKLIIKKDAETMLNFIREENDKVLSNSVDKENDKPMLDSIDKENNNSISTFINETKDGNSPSHFTEINNINIDSIISLLKNVSIEDLIFMLRSSLDFNISNLIKLDSVFLGKDTIVKNIKDLLKTLESKDIYSKHSKNIITLLNKFNDTLKNPENINVKDFYNSIIKELDLLKFNIKNNNGYELINSKIENIKTSLEFLNKINENITFIQIPIYINKNLQNCEIMIRKEKKSKEKLNMDNIKLSISLNTKTFDLVKILIEIRNKNIYLNIKCKSNKFKNIISKNEVLLSDRLKNIGYNNVFFRYNLYSSDNDNNINLFTELQDSIINTRIDMRV